MLDRRNVPLTDLVSFRLAGTANRVITVSSPDELQAALRAFPQAIVMGKGSNSLIDPDHLTLPILRLGPDFLPVRREGHTLWAHGGLSIQALHQHLVDEGLSGLEFCAGVPATVGGMTVMNFGCWDQDVSQIITAVRAMDRSGNLHVLDNGACAFGYRSSLFQSGDLIVMETAFALIPRDNIREAIQANIRMRLAKQPLRQPTFGSTFKNPPGFFAAKLIDAAGLKGYTYKNVQVSPLHANFLVNLGNATYANTVAVIRHIQHCVFEQSGIRLEPEVRLIHD
ncbi:MAG: UDP-N-acetylmuramate dehydrogenase [Candidatus Margulisiibacteriota bacterium]